MSRKYSHQLLRIAVAQICQNLGWQSAQSSSLEVLTDVLEKYLFQLSSTSHKYCEHAGRTQPNLDDLGLAFQQMGIDISELEDYVKHVDPVPFAHEVVAFPAPKAANLGFPSSRSREIIQHRKEHIPSHLPCMFPNMKDEIPEPQSEAPSPEKPPETLVKPEPVENGETNEASVGEKRPAPSSTPEMPPSKRPRFGNSNLPEEAGHSKYEMTCVFMGPNGVLTTRQGVQGRLPEPCLPPPNPRAVSEGSNKENSGKAKDGGSSGKISNSVGGIGANGVSSHKSESKKSKKSLHKKGKFSLDSGKEAGKKSASRKAAAKFIKRLKLSKKSAKLFQPHKLKDVKMPDHDPMDSDEEIRNLSSPASRDPSPEGDGIQEVGEKKKARNQAIDDSINAVLQEESSKSSKTKKKKKNLEKDGGDEKKDSSKKKGTSSGKKGEEKVKRKPGRPPKLQKTPEAQPAVDLKPFVSDKYSQDELQVYEFNDSPPDASVKARRPSAADTDNPASTTTAAATATSSKLKTTKGKPGRPSTKNSSSRHRLPKKDRHAVVEDDLFAPEIKLEHRQDKSKVDKQKLKVQPDSKGKQGKDEKHKDKKEKHREDRDRSLEKDKNKDKDHKKDKKDKKKEKEKKKKHKEKDHPKDKEKPREEKSKEEHRDSRDSSPSVGGVKLKIKLGGGNSSMMVTGDSNSSRTSSPTNRVARESMSPPRTVPKLYISRKGQEEKGKKPSKGAKHSDMKKRKGSPLAVSSKSRSASPTSNKASPSPRSTPTPPVPHKSTTPPPSSKSSSKLVSSANSKVNQTKKKKPVSSLSPTPASERKSRAPVKQKPSQKDKKKQRHSLPSLSSDSSDSSLSPTKSGKERKSPARIKRMSSSSSSPERSPAPIPFQSPAPSPPAPSRTDGDRSNSRTSSHRSPTTKKSSPSRSISPHQERRQSVTRSPSPGKPPTPGSTSPAPSPDWNLPVSPTPHHHRSPSPSPAHSLSHEAPPSPTTNWPPDSSPAPHRSPSPAPRTSSRPGSRQVGGTPEPRAVDIPSPTSSGKSSASAVKPNRGVEVETVCVFIDDSGTQVWICPACKKPDDGSEMIGCDMCDNWYHWPCVGITEAPPEEQQWFCPKCLPKTKATASRGRGRPRGRGRGRGRKKVT
ncbi:transcription initiation factor TFIID subunit 3 [Elysia marginata]|uniref:Transcription initiation factor TFIID subunit 3 n=1 Tax=Elysia marginata TaxID=1093978 RepID=A0AAV4FJQ0_9GAST|nr:transcription initiation factor TFIID subunit 3 [Elysia marginata]